MGYLDNSSITVEAILTKRGREILSQNGNLNITKFALADDEVDYSLWDNTHPLGTNYYGVVIENLPLLEAVPNESQVMKYKLVTFPKGTSRLASVVVGATSYTLNEPGETFDIAPVTSRGSDATKGYTVTVADSRYATVSVVESVSVKSGVTSLQGPTGGTTSISVMGKKFKITAKDVTSYTNTYVTTNIIITGNDSGATVTVPLTVYAVSVTGA